MDLPHGYTLRPVRLPDDGPAVVEIARRWDAASGAPHAEPAEQLLAHVAADGDDAPRNTTVAVDPRGQVVALVWFEVDDDAPEHPKAWVDVYQDPTCAAALEGPLLQVGIARTRTWMRERGHPGAVLKTGVVRGFGGLADLAREAGFTHRRTFWRMECDHDPAVPAVPAPLPPGVVVRAVAQTPGDRSALHRVVAEAFADHWGHVVRDEQTWYARLHDTIGVDPTQWWLAEVDGIPVGACIGDASRADDDGGYVRNLSVVRSARGRGIARHLLTTAFAEHRRRGWTWTQLTVDSENPTGATGLYTSVGMRAVEVFDVLGTELTIDPAEAAVSVAEPSTSEPL